VFKTNIYKQRYYIFTNQVRLWKPIIASHYWGAFRVGFRATVLLHLLKWSAHSRHWILQYKRACSQHWSRFNGKTEM